MTFPFPAPQTPKADLPDAHRVMARLTAVVGPDRAADLAATLRADLLQTAADVQAHDLPTFRRGCHVLVGLAGLAGCDDLGETARALLARTEAPADWPASGAGRDEIAQQVLALAAALTGPAPPAAGKTGPAR